jgi:hypothetical protein
MSLFFIINTGKTAHSDAQKFQSREVSGNCRRYETLNIKKTVGGGVGLKSGTVTLFRLGRKRVHNLFTPSHQVH